MSFTITFYSNNSENNAVSKSISLVTTATGSLRQSTSIVNPTVIIESALDSTVISNINYMYIPEFKRYYFVRDIQSINTGLWAVSAHCDVLMSFKDEILANRAIISRQENNWNLYLNDGIFRTYQNPIVQTKAFPSGFTTQEFVLAVAGGE